MELGSPLGWDSSFVEDYEKQKQFLRDIELEEGVEGKFSFIDVMECLSMIFVINKEIEQFNKDNGIDNV